MSEEEWRSVVGYEGLYEVSNMGRVRSLARLHNLPTKWGAVAKRPTKAKILNGTIRRRGGYKLIWLMREGHGTNRMVQSLVLEAFVGPRPNGMQACHFDGDASNNTLANLRWDTISANHKDKIRHGTSPAGSKNYFARLDEKSVSEIKAMLAAGAKPPAIAPIFGVHEGTIYLIRQGKTWQHV